MVLLKVLSSCGTEIFAEHQQLRRDVTSLATRFDLFCIRPFFFFFPFLPLSAGWFWIEVGSRKCPQLSVSLRGRKDSWNDKCVAVFLLEAEFGTELKLFLASFAVLHVGCGPLKCPDMFAD